MADKKECVIDFGGAFDEDGSLVYLEAMKDIPFKVKRIFYIFDVPNGMTRANHASANTDFLLIAINGSVTVTLNDGTVSNKYDLKERNKGLYVPNMTWMITSDFSQDAVLLVLASTSFDECCYIEDYEEFCERRIVQ